MNYIDAFSVDREEYQTFLEQINPKSYNVDVSSLNYYTTVTKVISKKTGKCLCSRLTYEERIEGQGRTPEKYYIFNEPELDERQAPRPKYTLRLETPEEVQAFVNIINKIKEGKKND